MAQRRMVSIKIIDSAKFLKMPTSTQSLYFHLITRADDDGVVEAFNVMRMIGSTEDDLKILVAKDFVVILNEDLVTFITDWKEHNLIRADRKIDSMYKNLLLQIIPEVSLIEPRQRADLKRKGQPMDDQWTTNGQHRIGKVRLGEDSIGKDNIKKKKETKKTNYDLLIDAYTTNQELKDTIYNFIKMRKSIKATITDNGVGLLLNKLDKLTNDDNKKIEMIEQSVMNSWKSVYEIKEDNNGNGVYGTKSNTGQAKKYNVKPPTTVELTDEERRRADEELL